GRLPRPGPAERSKPGRPGIPFGLPGGALMSHYRCTVDGRGDVRWLVEMVRSIRRIPQDAEGFARVNREALPYFEARLRAALVGRMVFDVVAPGSIVVFTSGC